MTSSRNSPKRRRKAAVTSIAVAVQVHEREGTLDPEEIPAVHG